MARRTQTGLERVWASRATGKQAIAPHLYVSIIIPGTGGTYWFRRQWRNPATGKTISIDRAMKLGVAALENEAAAIALARQWDAMFDSGRDPLEVEAGQAQLSAAERQKSQRTARFVFDTMMSDPLVSAGWKNRTSRLTRLKNFFGNHLDAALGDKPIAEVTSEHISDLVAAHWTTTQSVAKKKAELMQMIFDYAYQRKWITDLQSRVASWAILGRRFNRTAVEATHFPSMSWRRMPALCLALSERVSQQKDMAAAAALFCTLNPQRTDEILHTTWDELFLGREKPFWWIRGRRLKQHRGKVPPDLRVPLSKQSVALLKAIKRQQERDGIRTDYVFCRLLPLPGQINIKRVGRRFYSTAMLLVLYDFGLKGLHTPHGGRRSFNRKAKRDKVPYEIRHEALAHRVGTPAQRAYEDADRFDHAIDRDLEHMEREELCSETDDDFKDIFFDDEVEDYESRRELMQSWSDWCCAFIENRPAPAAFKKLPTKLDPIVLYQRKKVSRVRAFFSDTKLPPEAPTKLPPNEMRRLPPAAGELPSMEELVRATEALDMVRISKVHFYRLARQGKFNLINLGKASWVRRAELTPYLKAPAAE